MRARNIEYEFAERGVKNLFLTDGSCMTSSACQNPSLTYLAMTARACDYAVRQMKQGELRNVAVTCGGESFSGVRAISLEALSHSSQNRA